MFGFEKIDLSFSFNSVYFFIGLILLAVYSIYVYRFTLPPVSKIKRFILTALRTITLILLLFIFFEPVLTLTKKNILTTINLFYFDNSKSITIEDGTDRVKTINNLIKQVRSSSLNDESRYFSFGTSVRPVKEDF